MKPKVGVNITALPPSCTMLMRVSILESGTNVVGAHSIEEFVSKLKKPRKMVLLVKAGPAVDDFIAQLEPHLEKGDIIIDGGNSHYPDSIRRTKELESKGFLFVGSGVSGGEEGARYGPSLMPGGSDVSVLAPSLCSRDADIIIFRPGCLACYQGNLPKDRCSVRWRTMLRLGWSDRSWTLRQNGPQWDRIW